MTLKQIISRHSLNYKSITAIISDKLLTNKGKRIALYRLTQRWLRQDSSNKHWVSGKAIFASQSLSFDYLDNRV